MRKSIIYTLILTLLTAAAPRAAAASKAFSNETLHYVISYKWGLLHKDAGNATLTLRNVGDNYNVMLAARTQPWADKFYSVRDTLRGTITRNGLVPRSYVKITHEKGKYAKDEILYSKSGNVTKGLSRRYRPDENGIINMTEQTLSGTGPVYDMLSVYYYLRHIDYAALTRNKVYKATVFSGNMKETVTIRCQGIEKIKLRDKSEREAYHVKFKFTSDGGRKSSDDIDTWISTDDAHIPLYLVTKLPIGEVRVYFIPA